MEWLFGKKKTPAQMLRENKRLLDRTMRNLDRERVKMEQQEKKIIVDIKKMAKEGQMVGLCFFFVVALINKAFALAYVMNVKFCCYHGLLWF